MPRCLLSVLPISLILASGLFGDDVMRVPEPPKTDVPFLVLADNLVSPDIAQASQEIRNKGKKNEETVFSMPGEHANAKTPLASPIFAVKRKSLDLSALQLYPLQVVNGHREIAFSRKKQPQVYYMTATKSDEDVWRLEVHDSLPVGEYAISPSGSNQVFAFAVY
jgi:hypothetical protein